MFRKCATALSLRLHQVEALSAGLSSSTAVRDALAALRITPAAEGRHRLQYVSLSGRMNTHADASLRQESAETCAIGLRAWIERTAAICSRELAASEDSPTLTVVVFFCQRRTSSTNDIWSSMVDSMHGESGRQPSRVDRTLCIGSEVAATNNEVTCFPLGGRYSLLLLCKMLVSGACLDGQSTWPWGKNLKRRVLILSDSWSSPRAVRDFVVPSVGASTDCAIDVSPFVLHPHYLAEEEAALTRHVLDWRSGQCTVT